MKTISRTMLVMVLLLGLGWVTTPLLRADTNTANGVTIQVTTNQDEYDTIGSGMGCSLREAITAANKDKAFGGCPAGSGDDAIQLQAMNYLLDRSGEDDNNKKGDLDVNKPLTITGQGASVTSINGNKLDRVLQAKAHLTLTDIRITGGAPDVDSGGGIAVEKGLVVQNSKIDGNETPRSGGGIFTNNYGPESTITIINSLIQDNTAGEHGGGIFTFAPLKIENSTVDLNVTAGPSNNGGGLYAAENWELRNSTVSYNSADAHGGGIYNTGDGVIVNSTIAGNRAQGDGGGIKNDGVATLKLFNVTIVYNTADSNSNSTGFGGGISNPTCVNNCNIVELSNTLIGSNARRNAGPVLDDTAGYFVLRGYNLVQSPGGQYVGDLTGFIPGVHPGTSGLGQNGGSNLTVSLLSNSPAIDAGNPKGCKDDRRKLMLQDQRGVARIADGDGLIGPRCDLGAFEAALSANCVNKPGGPQLLKPTANVTVNKERVKLDWSDVPCAETYQVQVRQDAKNGTQADAKSSLYLSKYKSVALEAGHPFYWRVKACNAVGCRNSIWGTFSR